MQPLRLLTYLGENTTPIALDLAVSLSAATGREVVALTDLSGEERLEVIREGAADVFWLCGLLTVNLIDSGALDAQVVAAPVFAGAGGPRYHSVLVASSPAVNLGDLAGRRLVANEESSWSGYQALRAHLADAGRDLSMFSSLTFSGGHAASIDALLAGQADVAAIDHTVWEYRLAHDPSAASLHVIERTQDWPAPPFSVHRRLPTQVAQEVSAALLQARVSGLDAVVSTDGSAYDVLRERMRQLT